MRIKTEFQIYPKKHRSGRVSWLVNVGKVNGQRKLPAFQSKEEAEHYRAGLLERRALESPSALSDLSELASANVRLALEKLKPFEATILEAVDFFIRYAKPPKGKISIREAMEGFLKDNRRRGLSETYRVKSRTFFQQFEAAFGNCLLNEVSATKAKEYIYENPKWSAASKNAHLRHLRALYSYAIKTGHATLSPFKDVGFVKETNDGAGSKTLAVKDAEKLLDFALTTGRKAECATLALVLFCGVRMDETGRVLWSHLALDAQKPRVRIEHPKNNRRRVNDIPENAIHWLVACRGDGEGRVAPANLTKAMQRLRKVAKVPYKQNAARHSFASYHVALNDDAAKTATLLGHPNPALLYSTYRESVSREDAEAFFGIVPPAIREAQAKAKEAAKLKAQARKESVKSRLLKRGRAIQV